MSKTLLIVPNISRRPPQSQLLSIAITLGILGQMSDTKIGTLLSIDVLLVGRAGKGVQLVTLCLHSLDSFGTTEGVVHLFECGTTGLREEEVDGEQLDYEHAEEQEVESGGSVSDVLNRGTKDDSLPASFFNTNGNEILVEEETDVGGNVLHEQTVGTNVEWQQLQGVSDVERDPIMD